jgi:hypothetical protein
MMQKNGKEEECIVDPAERRRLEGRQESKSADDDHWRPAEKKPTLPAKAIMRLQERCPRPGGPPALQVLQTKRFLKNTARRLSPPSAANRDRFRTRK